MAIDVMAAADFYGTAQGIVTTGILRDRLAGFWPDLSGQSLLGVGYTAPYLRHWRDQTARTISLNPAQSGSFGRPAGRPCLSCITEDDQFPFADLSFDRIIMVHGLEQADNARRMLREVWRVLKDDGRLLVVVPNRSSAWAYLESTPFGHGQPYSSGQLGRLLSKTLFRVERRDTALYMPPSSWRPILRSASVWERIGRSIMPNLAGLAIAEATKDMEALIPLHSTARRRVVLAQAG